MQNFEIKELLKMFNQKQFFNGNADFNLDFDLQKELGDFKIIINEGRVLFKGFETLIRTFSGYDISKEIYKNGLIIGKIENNELIFDADLKSKNSEIFVKNGKINLKDESCQIELNIKINQNDAKIILSGDINRPKYQIQSDFMKSKTAWIGQALEKLGINL